MPSPRSTTFHYQSALALYCRTGEVAAIPGANQENLVHYRRLVYNVIDDMLENAYPLTRTLLSDSEWDRTVSDFFSQHPCQSPQVWYMPKEFYTYLVQTKHPILTKYPILANLLELEWIEVELFMMEDHSLSYLETGNLYLDKLVLNPEHALLVLNYPVHLKAPAKIVAADKGSYYVIVHRDAAGDVKFNQLSPALVRIVEYLANSPLNMAGLLELFESEYQLKLSVADREIIVGFIEKAIRQHLVLGFTK